MTNKKKIANILFLLAVFVATLYYVFHGQDISDLFNYIQDADIRFWFLAIICVILFILGESVIIYYLMKSIGQQINPLHCCLYSAVGFFFSCVTPGASGGQPMQLYFMKKDKIPLSIGTLVLMIVTITYKFILVLIGCSVLILRPPLIMQYLDPVINWCYLGVFLNVFAVCSMFMLIFQPSIASAIVRYVVAFLRHIRIFKHIDVIETKAEHAMEQYKDVSGYLFQHLHVIFHVLIITLIQRLCMFFVTYLAYRSLHVGTNSVSLMVILQGMISAAVDMLPLPGGMGISEKLFIEIFEPTLKEATMAVVLVSRGLSYYTELLLSAIFTVVAYFTIKEK